MGPENKVRRLTHMVLLFCLPNSKKIIIFSSMQMQRISFGGKRGQNRNKHYQDLRLSYEEVLCAQWSILNF